MRISDWSSDVCSSDLEFAQYAGLVRQQLMAQGYAPAPSPSAASLVVELDYGVSGGREKIDTRPGTGMYSPWGPWGWSPYYGRYWGRSWYDPFWGPWGWDQPEVYSYTVYRSEEHTSELQSLMRISSAVFCLKKKTD